LRVAKNLAAPLVIVVVGKDDTPPRVGPRRFKSAIHKGLDTPSLVCLYVDAAIGEDGGGVEGAAEALLPDDVASVGTVAGGDAAFTEGVEVRFDVEEGGLGGGTFALFPANAAGGAARGIGAVGAAGDAAGGIGGVAFGLEFSLLPGVVGLMGPMGLMGRMVRRVGLPKPEAVKMRPSPKAGDGTTPSPSL